MTGFQNICVFAVLDLKKKIILFCDKQQSEAKQLTETKFASKFQVF